jgi:hypothetical protein
VQPYPYQPPPPPPPRSGSSTGIIIAIVAVLFVLAILGLFAFLGVLSYMRASRAASYSTTPMVTTASPAFTTTPIPAATAALTESYSSPNGLVTAHYPSDWAAKSVDSGTLTISRNLSDGTDELVYVAGIENPITSDVDELARVLMASQTKTIEATGQKWIETARSHTKCFQTFPGLSVYGTFRAGTTQEKLHMCFWVRKNKAYVTKTMVPEIHETGDLPLLQSMVDASDFK